MQINDTENHQQKKHYMCFACGEQNEEGLHLSFTSACDKGVTASSTIGEKFQGYTGIAQGGIVATLLDSAMYNCLLQAGIDGLTARLNVRFIKPVFTGIPVTVEARLHNCKICMFELSASLIQENIVKATAEGLFFPLGGSNENCSVGC